MTNAELTAKAERIIEGPNGEQYYVLPVGSLSGDEFAKLITAEVARLQGIARVQRGGNKALMEWPEAHGSTP